MTAQQNSLPTPQEVAETIALPRVISSGQTLKDLMVAAIEADRTARSGRLVPEPPQASAPDLVVRAYWDASEPDVLNVPLDDVPEGITVVFSINDADYAMTVGSDLVLADPRIELVHGSAPDDLSLLTDDWEARR